MTETKTNPNVDTSLVQHSAEGRRVVENTGCGDRTSNPNSRSSGHAENPRTTLFRLRFFSEITDEDWNDWRWQSRHRIRTLDQFERMLELSSEERNALTEGGTLLPNAITPYFMSLLDPADALQPLRRTVVPTTHEFIRTPGEADDPLREDAHSPIPGLVHRYRDRVLLLPLDFCSTYCRYCTRSRVVGQGELLPNTPRLEAIFHYLEETPTVRDVVISGGEPLALSDDKLEWILGRLRAIPHIECLRISTKMPAVLPQRITPDLCTMLRKYHPLWISLQFLHPDECTPEAAHACMQLADAGIPLHSTTVLLKGVNDSVDVMRQLMHQLLVMRVRPDFIYQCDPISGSAHFRTPVSKGLEIIQGLRGQTSGDAVPAFVINAPGEGGRIVLSPDAVLGRVGDDLLLKNFEGRVLRYRDTLQDTSGENLKAASASNSELNKRRFELIDREIQGTISDSEKSELLQLTQLLRERIDADANLPLQGARTLHSYLLGLQTPNYSP